MKSVDLGKIRVSAEDVEQESNVLLLLTNTCYLRELRVDENMFGLQG